MSYWPRDYRRVHFHQYEICPLVGIRQLLWAFASLFQSITVLGFTVALSTDIVLYTVIPRLTSDPANEFFD